MISGSDWTGKTGLVTVDYHDDLKNVQDDPALAALLSAPAARAPFDRLDWWRGLADHCDLKPLLAVARDGDEAAILPLRKADAGLEALANWYTFRFRPVLSAGASDALLYGLSRDLARRTARIVLHGHGALGHKCSRLTHPSRICLHSQCAHRAAW